MKFFSISRMNERWMKIKKNKFVKRINIKKCRRAEKEVKKPRIIFFIFFVFCFYAWICYAKLISFYRQSDLVTQFINKN